MHHHEDILRREDYIRVSRQLTEIMRVLLANYRARRKLDQELGESDDRAGAIYELFYRLIPADPENPRAYDPSNPKDLLPGIDLVSLIDPEYTAEELWVIVEAIEALIEVLCSEIRSEKGSHDG